MAASSSSAVAPMTSVSRQEIASLQRQVQSNSLYNRQLSSICQVNGLRSTGVKAELQRRICTLLEEIYQTNDVARYQQVRQSLVTIANVGAKRPSPVKPGPSRGFHDPPLSNMPTFNGDGGANGSSSNGGYSGYYHNNSRLPTSSSALVFKPSPFYQIDSAIGDVHTCPVMSQHRSSVHIVIRLSDHPSLKRCVDDSNCRVMVFCAGDNTGTQDISFPHQSELKVNGGDVKANLRGLKNKPGSTRPVDITSSLRLKSSYTNNIEFTYALTQKKYYLVVYVCKVAPVQELVSTIATRRRIPKESVVAELNKKAQDPDVVATSQVLSLKCPLSYMRLDVPCRSVSCSHIQCFDATSYLQLQEQGPQWLCPICSKSAPFEQLAVDDYVRDILQNTAKSLETVTIEPNGRWTSKPLDEQQRQPSASASFDDDLEISEVNILGDRHLETPRAQKGTSDTPSSVDRPSTTTAPRGPGSISSKRPAPEVIDLTLSSDEDDDEPIQRPAKRQNLGANGYRDSRGGLGFLSESPVNFPQ